jgi:GT2 family glycosyltransferase
VVSRDRVLLPLNRGRVVSRWLFAPLVALSEAEHEGPEAEIGFTTNVGPLIRTSAARAAGLPIAEMFIRNDDVEYCLRLGGPGRMWLVPSARIVHKDEQPFAGAETLAARAREFLEPAPLEKEWKHLYALRNLVFLARRHGVLGPAKALSYLLVQVTRRLLLSERRGRAAYLAALYGADGLRGAFRNVVPGDWPAVVHADDVRAELHRRALRYGPDRAGVPERLGAAR